VALKTEIYAKDNKEIKKNLEIFIVNRIFVLFLASFE
jgi:hypothetical protein